MSEEVEPHTNQTAIPSGSLEERWFKQSVDRWVEKDGEFRQTLARRYETVKLIGSGHGAGLIAVAAFLNAKDSPQGWALVGAKACWIIFSLGVLMFCLSYYTVYRWESEVEKALFLRRIGTEWDNKNLKGVIQEAVVLLQRWRAVVSSIVLFGIGMCIVFLGVLFHG